LIEKGSDLNAGDNDGSTPLHKAAYSGETDCVALLLSHNANLSIKVCFLIGSNDNILITSRQDAKGATALHIAAYKNRLALAKLLIEQGADVNATDFDNVTPLHHTSFQGHLDFSKLLIEGLT